MKDQKDYIIYNYVGCVDQHLIGNVSFNIKSSRLFHQDEKIQLKKNKLIILAVEILQNIIKHSNNYFQPDSISYPSEFFIAYDKLNNIVTFEIKNILENQALKEFILKLDYTNNLTKEELIDAYKNQLLNGTLSEKSGAGLGLFEIRRITNNKIIYTTKKIDSQYTEILYSTTLNL